MKLQKPRGTRDILPHEQYTWNYCYKIAADTLEQHGYGCITTPSYEYTELFQRSIGKGTDVMDKELFVTHSIHALDHQNEYALRPEATAPVIRAAIEYGMHTLVQPTQLYSFPTCFRYERPQTGRYREHRQISIEHLGDPSAFADAWIIFCSWNILNNLGLVSINLQINTLGLSEERAQYISDLKLFFEQHQAALSADSKARISLNPMRILDSKDTGDAKIIEKAPKLKDYLSSESSERFQKVLNYLDSWKIPYEVNEQIIRGLDYYCHTTFEWFSTDTSGKRNALGGGGKYDDLITELGGGFNGAVGVGLGLDRIIDLLVKQGSIPVPKNRPKIGVVIADSSLEKYAQEIIKVLVTYTSITVLPFFNKPSISSGIKATTKKECTYVIIVGEEELSNQTLILKNLESSNQNSISLSDLAHTISEVCQN